MSSRPRPRSWPAVSFCAWSSFSRLKEFDVTATRVVLLLVLCMVAACTSPEAGRPRAGGAGADVGNRSKFVRMHEGADPFYKTPKLIGSQPPPLAGARQAEQLSRQ